MVIFGKVGTRCLPVKHSALKGRIEGKWCKNQIGVAPTPTER